MKYVVFVVEGQTELIFAQRFLNELITRHDLIHYDHLKLHGGILIPIGKRGAPPEDAKITIQIINAQGDDAVQSFISDTNWLEALKKKGVSSVFGLRDRFTGDDNKPMLSSEAIAGLKRYFQENSEIWGINVSIIIAVEEIEAWFLAEPTFFEKLDPSLTKNKLREILGDNFFNSPVEEIPHPARKIDEVLRTIGQSYRKREHDSHRIAEAINLSSLYVEKSEYIPALKEFIQSLDDSISFN